MCSQTPSPSKSMRRIRVFQMPSSLERPLNSGLSDRNIGEKSATHLTPYTPPRVWSWEHTNGGTWAGTNRPVAGPTHEKALL